MRRFLAALLLVILAALCLAPAALAAEWVDGRSPSKPYLGLPEVNLKEKLGYMMFYPNAKMGVERFCQSLMIYLPRMDVEAGKGTLYFCSEENGEEFRVAFNDETYVTQREMSEQELASLLWGEGTCFEITLPQSLKLGARYFVNMEKNCVVSGRLSNTIIGGTDAWAFTLEGDYGVSSLSYRRANGTEEPETVLIPMPGDEVRFDVVLGGEAASAAVFCWADSMSFDTVMITESGEVTGQVLASNPAWGIVFLDKDGNELWQESWQ